MPQLFTTGSRAELDTSITTTSNTLVVISGGETFPEANYEGLGELDQTSTEDWFKLVLQDDEGYEIVYCYKHIAGSNLFENLRRGQEGTTAKNFLTQTIVGLRPLGKDMSDLVAASKELKDSLTGKANANNPVFSGTVVGLTKESVGLENVDNTSDENKPISSATRAALSTKVTSVAGKGLSSNDFTDEDVQKLNGISTGATANSSDSFLLNRGNHTGSQEISTISGLSEDLSSKAKTLKQEIVTLSTVSAYTWQHLVITGEEPTSIVMPSNPAMGDKIRISVANGSTENSIEWSGKNHEGSTESITKLDVPYGSHEFEYINAGYGWKVL